jgi:hypothetical protein
VWLLFSEERRQIVNEIIFSWGRNSTYSVRACLHSSAKLHPYRLHSPLTFHSYHSNLRGHQTVGFLRAVAVLINTLFFDISARAWNFFKSRFFTAKSKGRRITSTLSR